eukprot:1531072-Prymnesium_polylepis.1
MAGSMTGHRCRIRTSRRSNSGLPDTESRWPRLGLVDTRPPSTVRSPSGLLRAGDGLSRHSRKSSTVKHMCGRPSASGLLTTLAPATHLMELLAPSVGVYVPLWLERQSSKLVPPMSGLCVPAAARRRYEHSRQPRGYNDHREGRSGDHICAVTHGKDLQCCLCCPLGRNAPYCTGLSIECSAVRVDLRSVRRCNLSARVHLARTRPR